jgi:hypothetical protein
LTVTKTKPDTITPGVAAQQAEWHCTQSAEHFRWSVGNCGTATSRDRKRRNFLADARHALPTMGLEAFLAKFRLYLFHRGDVGCFDEAKPIITALAAELALVPRAVAVAAASVPVSDALTNAKSALAAALAKVDEALRAVEVTGELTAVETRG